MKFPLLYLIALLSFGFLSISSFSEGPTEKIGDRTLSPISAGACNGCHDFSGDFAPTISISLKDSSNTVVTNGMYKPGQRYTLSVLVNAAPANGIIPKYGSQTVVLNSSNYQAGTLLNPSTGVNALGDGARLYSLNGRTYLEHNKKNPSGIFNAEWIAPVVGTGVVKIYSMGLAVNSDSTFIGDNHIGTSLTLQEDLSIGVDRVKVESLAFRVFPNPASSYLQIEGLDGVFSVIISDILGNQVYNNPLFSTINTSIQLPKLVSGVYTLQISKDNKIGTQQIIIL